MRIQYSSVYLSPTFHNKFRTTLITAFVFEGALFIVLAQSENLSAHWCRSGANQDSRRVFVPAMSARALAALRSGGHFSFAVVVDGCLGASQSCF